MIRQTIAATLVGSFVLVGQLNAGWVFFGDADVDTPVYRIRRANQDGSNLTDVLTLSCGIAREIALDTENEQMYWTETCGLGLGNIRRANFDGSGVETLASSLQAPWGIGLDLANGKVYWSDRDVNRISRANLDGSNVEHIVTGLGDPRHLDIDVTNGKVYWTDDSTGALNGVFRAALDGSGVEHLVTGIGRPHGIALDLDGANIYWTDGANSNNGNIYRSGLDGMNAQVVVSGLGKPKGIALDLDAGKMYWTDSLLDKVQRANLDGSSIEDIVPVTLGDSTGIALTPIPEPSTFLLGLMALLALVLLASRCSPTAGVNATLLSRRPQL